MISATKSPMTMERALSSGPDWLAVMGFWSYVLLNWSPYVRNERGQVAPSSLREILVASLTLNVFDA